MSTVEIDADVTYELDVDHFDPGHPDSYWDPPDPAEISFGNIVTLWYAPDNQDVVTFETFILNYAQHFGISVSEAEDQVHEKAIEILYDKAADRDY